MHERISFSYEFALVDHYGTIGLMVSSAWLQSMARTISDLHRAVQWHYIDKLSNDTVPNHTFITTNHQALFIYNRTKITE